MKHNVEMESLKYLRSSFKHQAENGALRRPQIHVEFSHPKYGVIPCLLTTRDILRDQEVPTRPLFSLSTITDKYY